MYFHRFVTDEYHSINRDITIIETAHDWKKEILVEIYQSLSWNVFTIMLKCIVNYIKIYEMIYIYV